MCVFSTCVDCDIYIDILPKDHRVHCCRLRSYTRNGVPGCSHLCLVVEHCQLPALDWLLVLVHHHWDCVRVPGLLDDCHHVECHVHGVAMRVQVLLQKCIPTDHRQPRQPEAVCDRHQRFQHNLCAGDHHPDPDEAIPSTIFAHQRRPRMRAPLVSPGVLSGMRHLLPQVLRPAVYGDPTA